MSTKSVYRETKVRGFIKKERFQIAPTHIKDIKKGDLILHDGEVKTVCKSDINFCSFMGVSVFGDNYYFGYKPVEKVINYAAN